MSNPDEPDRSKDLARISELVGDLHTEQRYRVSDALDENRDGVMRVAERLARTAGLRNPVGVLLWALDNGQHLQEPEVRERSGGSGPDARDAFRRLYKAKLTDLTRIGWGRSEHERQRESLDYAVSYLPNCKTGPLPDGGALQLESELAAELGIER